VDIPADSLPLPGCEAIWQKTLALADLDPVLLKHQLIRNAQPAYGLTLVADYPLPGDVLLGIERLRQVCKKVLGDGVEFTTDEHLHLTVYSLLRSRTTPLPEEELANIWLCWLPRLEELAGKLPPLGVILLGLAVTSSGSVLVCGAAVTDSLSWFQEQVGRLPGVAAPRDVPLHVTIGQIKRPCGSRETFARTMAVLGHHIAEPVGMFHFNRLHVLYYSSRLLNRVLRSETIPLAPRAQ
jgi:hypothetical protein